MPNTSDRTFARQLKHFARSVDIVDDATFDRVRRLIYQYVRDKLRAEYFELMRAQPVGNEPGLATFWSSDGKNHVLLVRASDGSSPTLMCRAFERNTPMWVVNPEKLPLAHAPKYQDQWSEEPDLPGYTPVVNQTARTVVVVPLRHTRVLGIYYLEIAPYIEVIDVAKEEVQLLGDAMAILLELWEANQNQTRLTQEAIDDLNLALSSVALQLTKPGVFLGYSERADDGVLSVIREVLDQFANKVEVIDWGEIDEAGAITAQIVKKITRAKFGVCYLSEPAASVGESTHVDNYVDNPNVLFEAGMLHALTNPDLSKDEPGGWIPIREEHSPMAPFDFQSERMLIVPRTRSRELDRTRLKSLLERRLRALLGNPEEASRRRPPR